MQVIEFNLGVGDGFTRVKLTERADATTLWWTDGINDWEETLPSVAVALVRVAALAHIVESAEDADVDLVFAQRGDNFTRAAVDALGSLTLEV